MLYYEFLVLFFPSHYLRKLSFLLTFSKEEGILEPTFFLSYFLHGFSIEVPNAAKNL